MADTRNPSRIRGLAWVLVALSAAVAPHVMHMPAWVTLLLLAVGAWRWTADLRGWPLVPTDRATAARRSVGAGDPGHLPHTERDRGRHILSRPDGGGQAARDACRARSHGAALHRVVPAVCGAVARAEPAARAVAPRQRIPDRGCADARARAARTGADAPCRAPDAAVAAAGCPAGDRAVPVVPAPARTILGHRFAHRGTHGSRRRNDAGRCIGPERVGRSRISCALLRGDAASRATLLARAGAARVRRPQLATAACAGVSAD